MTNSKNTKRALLMSLLSMVLCVAMLVGSTFAWFTDTATSGNNRIIAGNLDIDLLDADGNPLEEGKLFGTNLLWEPGQMYYRELKVVNKGSLAAKINVCINEFTFDCNFVLFPNEDGTYSLFDDEGLDRSLGDVIRVAAYVGTFDALKTATEEETGKTYASDRDMLKDALEYGVIEDNIFSIMDSNEGGLLKIYDEEDEEGDCEDYILPPNGEKDKDGNALDEIVFTLIAYWAMDGDWIYEDFGRVDDDYNMNNGKVATHIPTDEEWDLLTAKDGAFDEGRRIPAEVLGKLESALQIDFDITVFATQVPYESDSFGNDYDDDLKYVDKDTLLRPGIGD